MILLGLIRVEKREVREGSIEVVALAEIPCNHRCIAGLGVSASKRPAAAARITLELHSAQMLERNRHLHVAELAHIKIPTILAAHPAKEDIARRLHQALSHDDTLPLIVVSALLRVTL